MKFEPVTKTEKTVNHFKFTTSDLAKQIKSDLIESGHTIKEAKWNTSNKELTIITESEPKEKIKS